MPTGNEINFFFNYIPPKIPKHWDAKWKEKWQERREFFSCNSKYNYLNYMETGSPGEENKYLETIKGDSQPSDTKKRAKSYLEYMEDKKKTNLKLEKSSGLFDKEGMLTKDKRVAFQNKLQATKGIICEGVITFESEFGAKHCADSTQAQEAMKIVFKQFLNKTQFRERNVEWTAALHENTDHFHIHWTFFEKEPWRTSNFGSEKVYTSKGIVKKECFDYLKTSFYKYCTEKSINVHSLRDKAINKLKTMRIDLSKNGGYYKEFKTLYKELGIKGAVKYESLSKEQKRKIDAYSIRIIRADAELTRRYQETFSALARAKEELTEFTKNKGYASVTAKADSFRDDLFLRMGKSILKGCVKSREREIKSIEYIDKVLRDENSFKNKKRTQTTIRRIKKGLNEATYKLFKNEGVDQPHEAATGMIKNYKWIQLVEEEKERDNEQGNENKHNSN